MEKCDECNEVEPLVQGLYDTKVCVTCLELAVRQEVDTLARVLEERAKLGKSIIAPMFYRIADAGDPYA